MGDDDPDGQDDHAPLIRIARALRVPVTSFFGGEPAESTSPEMAAPDAEETAQAVRLLRLFLRVRDPEARARCLAFVVAEATR